MAVFKVILSIVFSLSLVLADKSIDYPGINYKLSPDISPISYVIKIIPCMDESNSSFAGQSEIKIDVSVTTQEVTLHAKELMIRDVFAISENEGKRINSINHTIDKLTSFLSINFESELMAHQNYTLFFDYQGNKLRSEEPSEYIKSYFRTETSENILLQLPFLQSTDVSRFFPCFNEPGMKATFSISMKHPKKYHAISNLPIVKREPALEDAELMWTTVAKNEKMPAYLIELLISNLTRLDNDAHDFTIWAEEEELKYGTYALEIGPKILKLVEDYTGITRNSTEHEKINIINGPGYGHDGRYGNILFEDNFTTFQDKESVTLSLAETLVTHWYGNLVTPKSWQFIWLDHGFVNYFATFFAHKIQPTWGLDYLYVVHDLQSVVLPYDLMHISMNHPAEAPCDILMKVDSTIRKREGFIVRMISHVLTEAKFQKSLRRYLKKMSYKAATPDDLFDEFCAENEESGLSKSELREALNNWADNTGFPVITVTRDYATNSSVVTQERSLSIVNPNYEKNYWVPINYAQGKSDFNNTKVTSWLHPNDTSTTIDGLENHKWAIFNIQHFGYYRVNYDKKNWELIIEALKSEEYQDIHILNRGQLLDDAFTLADSSKLNWSIALGLASYLKKEKNYVPWKSASSGLLSLKKILWGSDHWKDYQKFVLNLLEPLETSLGYELSEGDDHMTKYFKQLIRELGCSFGSEYCNNFGRAKVKAWLAANLTGNDPNEDLFCSAIRNLSIDDFNTLKEIRSESGDYTLLAPFSCSSDENILKSHLNETFNLYPKLMFRIVRNIMKYSENGVDIVLDTFIEKSEAIANKITTSENGMFGILIHSIKTEKQLNKYEIMMTNIITYLPVTPVIKRSNDDFISMILKRGRIDELLASGLIFARQKVESLKTIITDVEQFFDGLKVTQKK